MQLIFHGDPTDASAWDNAARGGDSDALAPYVNRDSPMSFQTLAGRNHDLPGAGIGFRLLDFNGAVTIPYRADSDAGQTASALPVLSGPSVRAGAG